MTGESVREPRQARPTARALVALGVTAVVAVLFLALVPVDYYYWVKAAHIISVIAWMAGMLYLPRLFVYHAQSALGSEQSETFKVMERRLLRGIINPAMVATWVFGLWLAWRIFAFQPGWLQAKISLVIGLSAVHGYYAIAVRRFAEDRNTRSVRHWRIMNEVPTLLLIAIVILVVVKPF